MRDPAWILGGFLVVAAVVAGMAPAAAGSYANSDRPYWDVGTLDRSLSQACRRREFGQLYILRASIGYQGDKGRGITGIAKKGWNLYDPKGLGKLGLTYHFFNDGYSNCKVYVSGKPQRPPPPAPPQKRR